MAVEVATLKAYITADLNNFASAMNTADQRMDASAQKATETGQKIEAGLSQGTTGATDLAAAAGTASTAVTGTAVAAVEMAAKVEGAGAAASDGATKLGDMASAASGLATLLAHDLINALENVVKQAFDVGVRFDSLDKGLTAIMGSSERAAAELDKLREVAKLPGIGLEEAEKGSIALQAAGASADLARHAIEAFGNAIARAGKGKEDLDAVDNALSHILATGRATEREIREISMRAPEVRQAMVKAFGTADTMLLEKAQIGGQEFVTRLTRELAKLPKAASGVKNDLDNATDSINQSLNEIAKVGLPALSHALSIVVPLIQDTTTVFVTNADAIGGFLHDVAKWTGLIEAAKPTIDSIKAAYEALHLTAQAELQNKSLGKYGDSLGIAEHADKINDYIRQLQNLIALNGQLATKGSIQLPKVEPKSDLSYALAVGNVSEGASVPDLQKAVTRLTNLRWQLLQESVEVKNAYFESQKALNGGTVRPKTGDDGFKDVFNLQARLDAAAANSKGAAARAAREAAREAKEIDDAYKSLYMAISGKELNEYERKAADLMDKRDIYLELIGDPKAITAKGQDAAIATEHAVEKVYQAAMAAQQKAKAGLQHKADEAMKAMLKASGMDDSTAFKALKSNINAGYKQEAKAIGEALKMSGMDDTQNFKAFQTNYATSVAQMDAVTTQLNEALGDAGARYLEAMGAGDHYADVLGKLNIVTKELTPEQKALVDQIVDLDNAMRAMDLKKEQIGNISGQLSSPFTGYFSDLAGGKGKDAAKRFSENMRGQLSGMFGELLGNQVKNGLRQALTPLYDEVSESLKGGLNSVKITLAGMQESVGLMLSQAYGLLAIIGGMGKKSQGGGILGAILGGVVGSLIPGVGTLVGASIGSSLGSAVSSGNPAGILAAGLGAYGTISAAGAVANSSAFAAGTTPKAGLAAAFNHRAEAIGGGSGSRAEGISGAGSTGGYAVPLQINLAMHGDVNNMGDMAEFQNKVAKAVQTGLRTPGTRQARVWKVS